METQTNSDRPASKQLKQLRDLLPFAKPYLWQIAAALTFLGLGAVATLSLPIAVRRMIDLGFDPANQSEIGRYFLLLLAVAMAMALFTAARYFCVSWLGERIVADLRKAVFNRVVVMSPSFFETTRTGEVLSRINTDTTLVEVVVGSTFSIALRSFVMFVGAGVMMAVTSPSLAGYIALLIPVIILPVSFLGKWIKKLSKLNQDRIADLSAYTTETLNAIETVQAYAQDRREQNRFAKTVESVFGIARKRFAAESIMSVIIVSLMFGGIVGILWLGARSVIDGEMTAGTLSQFVLYAIIAATTTGALTQVYGELQRAAGAMERIAELLGLKPDIASPETPAQLSMPVRGDISIRNLTFAYSSRLDEPVLEDLNLEVKAGETVALVGPSGAGKSTLFLLLMRFYDPQTGTISLDGLPINTLDVLDYRAQLALVAQSVTVFSADARTNIAYGKEDATEADIARAANLAHADEFINKLPEKYQTFLGERGVRLSGGQAQRVSIARALLVNPPVLLLDEATSALDAHSERRVKDALDQLMRDRTTLVISHRLATIRNADRIAVMDAGRIVAQGTHEELLQSSELYNSLAKLQFSD